MSARWPRPLGAGGRIHLWAPSSSAAVVFPRRFRRGVAALEAVGYEVCHGASCGAAEGTASPSALADELHQALADERCDAVMAVTGGWTTLTVLPMLDIGAIVAAGKPIIGYSDVSSLLNVVAAAGLVGLHGPMVMSEWGEADGPWAYTVGSFRAVVRGRRGVAIAPAPRWSDELLWWDSEDVRRRRASGRGRYRVLREGAAEGTLWGGNVAALGLLAGTPLWPAVPDGAIVVLEAWQVAPGEWWAHLEHLRMCGVFRAAGGVVVARIGQPRAAAGGQEKYDEIVRTVVRPGVPVLADVDAGHTEPMCTLPIGGRARVTCANEASELVVFGP